MPSLVLLTLLQLSSGDLSLTQAEALARRDEWSLEGERAAAFFDTQDQVTGRALVNCGVEQAREASGLKVVMRLDAQGRVVKTWLNNPSALGRCFEAQLRSVTFPTDGRTDFYTFIGFSF